MKSCSQTYQLHDRTEYFEYKFNELYCSTLSQGEIDVANNNRVNPEATKFQYDFLNDGIIDGKIDVLNDPKLPQGLKDAILNGKEIVNCVDLRIQDFHDRYLKHDEFYYGMYEELKSAIGEANSEYKKWQKNSLELFDNKFSPKVWENN